MCNMFEQLARHSSSIPEGSVNGYIIVMIRLCAITLNSPESLSLVRLISNNSSEYEKSE